MNLGEILKEKNIFIADKYPDTDSFYNDFSKFLKKNANIKNSEKVKLLFIKRESVQSTAIGKGAAAPHIFSDEFSEFVFFLALIKEGMDFKSSDNKQVYLIFLIMSDEREVGLHLKSLAHIARLVSSTDIVEAMKSAQNSQDVINIYKQKDQLI